MKKDHKKLFVGKRILITMLFVLGVLSPLLAQVQIKGTVRDDQGMTLPGVNIYEKGTQNGTVTNIDGAYSLNVVGENSVIVVSFIGFVQQEVTIGTQTTLDVVMQSDATDLDEVVVVGYGAMKKSHLTGAIAKLETQGLEDIPSSRADQALQGRVAGVTIQNTTSQVGESPQISIRGAGSISANGQPLVIVDGFPISDGLSVVDVADIESMEVLKDAASAAIYGSRAANGVIIITTKSGSEDKPKYNARVSYGVKEAYALHDVMTKDEYVAMETREQTLLGRTQLSEQIFAMSTLNEQTDWQEEALDPASIVNAQFNVSGGKKGMKYYVSTSYLGDEGIMDQNTFDRFNMRMKLEADLSKKVKVGVSMSPTYTKRTKPTNNYTDFLRTPGFIPVFHNEQTSGITGYEVGDYTSGNHFNDRTYTGVDPISGEERIVEKASPFNTSSMNPRHVMDNSFYNRHDYRMNGNAYLKIKLAKGLDFKTSNGFNVVYSDINEYHNQGAKVVTDPNYATYNNSLFTDLLTENIFTYKLKKDVHNFDALLGFSAQERRTKTAGIMGTDFPTDYIHTLNGAGSIVQWDGDSQETGTWIQEESLVSVFSRIAYSYMDKYLLSASFRGDGSSKFGENNRWGFFPSVSLGWRISEEAFFKDNVSWIDQLKLRGSYGVTGTDDIVNYSNTNMLTPNNYVLGSSNGTINSGLSNTASVLGNPDLMWEQTNEFNYGIDVNAFNGRINLGLDYYYSVTRSLLYERSINSVSGFTQAWSNEGKVRNKGVEVVLTTQNVVKNDFRWNTTFNFAVNRNKVLDLGGPEYLINQGERSELYATRVGDPLVQYYGFKTDGVWASQAEIDANPSHNADQPGGLRLVDMNGDGKIDDDDLTVIGSPMPDFNWGVTNTFTYKGFDASFLLQGVVGVDVVNGDAYYNETRRYNKNFNEGRWISEEHPGNGVNPAYNTGINVMLTDYAVENATYFTLRDLTIGYSLPKNIARKASLSKVRFYLSGQNLFYWWSNDYRGINPEALRTSGDYSSPLITGYQRGAFPVQRVYSAGIDINF